MARTASASKDNSKRVAAARQNQLKRGPWTDEQRERVRQAIQRTRPWLKSTGPKTAAGKAKVAENGKKHQRGELSIPQLRAQVGDVTLLIEQMKDLRRSLTGDAPTQP